MYTAAQIRAMGQIDSRLAQRMKSIPPLWPEKALARSTDEAFVRQARQQNREMVKHTDQLRAEVVARIEYTKTIIGLTALPAGTPVVVSAPRPPYWDSVADLYPVEGSVGVVLDEPTNPIGHQYIEFQGTFESDEGVSIEGLGTDLSSLGVYLPINCFQAVEVS